MEGLCLDKITSTFPTYSLSEVEKDIHKAYKEAGRNPKKLPKLAESVGGDTHIMIGSLYKKHYPKELFRLVNGLSIYKSFFEILMGLEESSVVRIRLCRKSTDH